MTAQVVKIVLPSGEEVQLADWVNAPMYSTLAGTFPEPDPILDAVKRELRAEHTSRAKSIDLKRARERDARRAQQDQFRNAMRRSRGRR